MATLRQVVHHRISSDAPHSNSDLWSEIEAAARRSPEIGAAAQKMEAEVTTCLLGVFAKETGLALKEVASRFSASAAYVLVLFKAASCLNCAPNTDQTELKSMIIRTIDQTLDEVFAAASNSDQKA